MVYRHDEVVAAAGLNEELAHVVGVELANELYPDIEFFGLGGGVRWRWRRCFGRHYGLDGLNALSRLFYVILEGFIGTEQYLDTLAEVRPGQEAYLPALMAAR